VCAHVSSLKEAGPLFSLSFFDMSDIEEYQPLFGQKKNKRSTLQKYGYYIATGVVLFTASLFLGHFVYESKRSSFII
jgi:hypothetical protein